MKQYADIEIVDKDSYREKFRQKKCCVIVPTYNNCETLAQLVKSVAEYTDDIVIVNDGSTDATIHILKDFERFHIVHHASNKGKGIALRTGFSYATSHGYDYAITIDSDGQHMAYDLPRFLEKLEENPSSLIVGARNMDQASVPKRSNFGNRVSTFWFTFETGVKLPDTQSGYRLYPIYLLKDIKFLTWKYEFEIEVLVRASWKGINVTSVPVTVYYPPDGHRVTHFKPFKDSTRVTILNIVLVIISVLYIKPLQTIRKVKEVGLGNFLRANFLNANESNLTKALSVSLGIFMGIVPLWGLQMIIAIFLAFVFKLNKAIVLTTANISLPPMIPFIIYFSYVTGGFIMGNSASPIALSSDLSLTSLKNNFLSNIVQYYVGGTVFALIMGIASGLVAFLILAIFRRKRVIE